MRNNFLFLEIICPIFLFGRCNIPKGQKERYDILLKFFKDVFSSIPSLQPDLKRIFVSVLQKHEPEEYERFINVDPYALLMDMKTSEMS